MLICNPYEIVIQGVTNNNKRFRPSDWAERLCGILSSFDQGHRLSYHQWVRPILIDNIRWLGDVYKRQIFAVLPLIVNWKKLAAQHLIF